ncbi:RHS repeat domain-containing protein [Methylomonas fluvii]|uniref:RHS repeat domain-containing protein n=1 Tax=Methylomonas fluvii TaxID=1854564 RepID=UPI0019E662B5|nr:RHS repeat-associated core domain-containing protein [Methylomonas fluvii]CAD6871882.1 Rhs-family protein [Methylomonas fluvii]
MALYEQDNSQASGTTYHYHLDHLGTPRELTDTDGRIVWSARYRAYGNLALADVEAIDNPLRFQGQYYDQETGLHYNLNRYYDPNAGRFIHQDPIGLLGGNNLYQYVPNPVNWIDPLGLTCSETTNSLPAKGYHKEVYASKPVKPENAVDKWDEFLGPGPHSNIHPRTGLPDPDRIVSADGKRSIRYGSHEMNSTPTKHHYHEETWTFDSVSNVMNVDNKVVRVPLPKN